MTNDFVINSLNKIEGFKTRLAELHWSSPSISVHQLIDEFQGEIGEFEDIFAEQAQALWGFITPKDLNPILPDATNFGDILEDIRGLLTMIKRESGDSTMWTGIINEVDDFFMTVNRFIYLNKIALKNIK